jgi:hypothetical protein
MPGERVVVFQKGVSVTVHVHQLPLFHPRSLDGCVKFRIIGLHLLLQKETSYLQIKNNHVMHNYSTKRKLRFRALFLALTLLVCQNFMGNKLLSTSKQNKTIYKSATSQPPPHSPSSLSKFLLVLLEVKDSIHFHFRKDSFASEHPICG